MRNMEDLGSTELVMGPGLQQGVGHKTCKPRTSGTQDLYSTTSGTQDLDSNKEWDTRHGLNNKYDMGAGLNNE